MFKRFILLLSFIVVLLNFTNCGSGGGGTSDGNKAPVVNAGSDKSAKVNQSITIVGSATDSDGKIVSYEWKKGNMVLATTPTFNYLPTVVGTDKLTLVVIDDDGAVASDSMVVTVSENGTSTLSKGLIAHYEFEGNTTDSSVNKNDGIEHGGVSYVDGVIGKAGSFDGIDDWITLPTFNKIWKDGITICSWAKFKDKNRNFERIIDIGNGNGDNGGIPLWLGREGKTNNIAFESWISDNSYTNREKGRISKIDSIVNGKFAFYCASIKNVNISDGEMSLYIDGNKVKNKNGNSILNIVRKKNFIGLSNWKENDALFNGLIDDLRIYNRALTESEIQELYNLK